MIGFALHHSLSYYFLKTGNTKDVLDKIAKMSQYGSCVIYIILAFLLWNSGVILITVLCIAAFESLAMSILPVLKTSAAFELIRIDAANNGCTIDSSGYIFKKTVN
jgi:hypothetical protein